MIDAILSVLSKQWISSYYIEKVKLNDIISNIFLLFYAINTTQWMECAIANIFFNI